jgi:DNA repair protein SbcD/Mre11
MSTPLKLLHTSDWHLGKRLFKLERLPEQELFLTHLLELVKREGIHHLLVAGDIFDVPQPPHRALRLFYDFIATFTVTTSAQMWLIGGNHDSSTLLDAPQGLIDEKRVHLFGGPRAKALEHWRKLPLPDGRSHVDLCVLPYFRPYELSAWKTELKVSEEGWVEKLIESFLKTPPANPGVGRILMGHHLFGAFEAAGSEQALSLSGMDSLPLDWCQQFDYLALGHIHKPQTLKKLKPLARYSGSPIPMRFSETAPKGVELISWDESGMTHQTLPLPVWRPLLSFEVTESNWREKLQSIALGTLPVALELILKLKAPVPGLIESIRVEAQTQDLELLSVLPQFEAQEKTSAQDDWVELLQLSPSELFESFYLSKFPGENAVPHELVQDMKSLLEEARRAPPSA